MDITELILHDHLEQRRMFAFLEDVPPSDTRALTAVWARLRVLLEVHAKAEEELFYPVLLQVGKGAEGDSVEDEVRDVIKDHNDIRDAIAEAENAETGTKGWWAAVAKANNANGDHMAEEERDDLPDFRRHATLQQRHDIAVAFATFEAEHAMGVVPQDEDPDRYLRAHQRSTDDASGER